MQCVHSENVYYYERFIEHTITNVVKQSYRYIVCAPH